MVCTNPVNLSGVELPCNKCLSCRIRKSVEWRNRIIHELDYYKDTCFITLTFEDENIKWVHDLDRTTTFIRPQVSTIDKTHLQNFFKRLRKNYGTGFKYFAIGDYGEDNFRPHYHIILLGISQNWVGFKFIKSVYSKGKKINLYEVDQWTNGYVHVGTVTPYSVRYVTDYLTRKLYGTLAQGIYGAREKPFKIVSQGLGKRYCIEHRTELVENEHYRLHGVPHGLPRYYRDILNIKNPVYTNQLNARAVLKDLETAVMLKEQTGSIKSSEKENQLLLQKIRKQQDLNLQAKINLKGVK